MPFVTCDSIEVIHCLVEATKLVAEHATASILIQRAKLVVSPVAHSPGYLEGGLIAAEPVLVNEPLENLVQGVERSPDTLALDVAVYKTFAESRKISCAILLLHFC